MTKKERVIAVSYTHLYSLTGLIGMFDSRVSRCANDQNMRDVLVDAFGKAEIHLGNLTMRPGHHVPAEDVYKRQGYD